MDIEAVGGIGIEITQKMINELIENNIFTVEEYEENSIEAIEKITSNKWIQNSEVKQAGDMFTGDVTYYLLMKAETLEEANCLKNSFLNDLGNLINISENNLPELKIISDFLVF